jgi:hypothetical protein
LEYLDAADYSTVFIVNDDAAGPYRWMELTDTNRVDDDILNEIYKSSAQIKSAKEHLRKLRGDRVTTVAIFRDSNGKPTDLAGIDFLVAPLPRAVTLSPKEAQDKALVAILTVVPNALPRLILRTFLTESNKFKQHIRTAAQSSPKFAWWVQSFYYPKWVWVTEITEITEIGAYQAGADPAERRIDASVVIDSSAARDTLDFVVMHVGGSVIRVDRSQRRISQLIKDIATGNQEALIDPDYTPYTQMKRQK